MSIRFLTPTSEQKFYPTINMKLKEKLLAASIHLAISFFIFSFLLVTIYFFWFPEPFFTAAGGWQGIRLITFIDLVLGPLLTFIVFNRNKPKRELRTDLGIIGLLQLAALIWGWVTVYNERPVALVFWESSFYTIPFKALSPYKNTAQYQEIIKTPRRFYYAQKPATIEGINAMLERLRQQALTPYQQLEQFKDFAANFDRIQQHSIDIDEIIEHNADMKQQLAQQLTTLGVTKHDLIYLPLLSRYQNIILLFSNDATLKGYIKAPYKNQAT